MLPISLSPNQSALTLHHHTCVAFKYSFVLSFWNTPNSCGIASYLLMANIQNITVQNLEYHGVQRGSVTGVNLIISVFEDNIVCVEKRVAATDREGREGLGGWWVLSYNWPLNTSKVIPSCSRLFCTAKYYHIIGPSILYPPTFLYCWVLSYNWRSSSVPPARLLLARRRNCEVILHLCFSDYGGG